MTQQSNPPRGDLAHYGVKGMHWGVRKGDSGSAAPPSRKVKKADAKFEKNASTVKTFVEVHNRAAAYANQHVDRINNKPQYKNADFSKDSPLRRKYYAEHAKSFNDGLKIAANSLGTNASGTRRYTVTVDNETGAFGVHTEAVKHADEAPFKVVPKFDAKGHIISFSIEEESSVAHYGVKGMHWGVRKGDSSGGTPKLTKAQLNAAHPDYGTRDRARDAIAHPAGAVKRINQRMNKGMDLRTARKKEGQRTLLKAAGLVALYNTPKILNAVDNMVATHGANTMAGIRTKAQTNRGRAQAAATMGLPSKPTNGPTYSKKSRQGVHKITTL